MSLEQSNPPPPPDCYCAAPYQPPGPWNDNQTQMQTDCTGDGQCSGECEWSWNSSESVWQAFDCMCCTVGGEVINGCEKCDCSDKNNGQGCLSENCEECDNNGNCVSKCDPDECQECDGNGNCESTCNSENCLECDGNGSCVSECSSETTSVSYDTGISSVVSGIESGLNSIPCIAASGWNCSASFSAEKGQECCDGSCTDYYDVSGSVDLSGSIGVEVPGLSWHWEKEWKGYGGIDSMLGVSVEPSITLDLASVAASGKVSECDSCFVLDGSVYGSGKLTCTAGGVVTLWADLGSDWLEFSLNVNISAKATVSTDAWASGLYQDGPECDFTGFCLTCYGVSETTATGTVTFQVGTFGPYSAPSDPLTIIDGCHVHPDC